MGIIEFLILSVVLFFGIYMLNTYAKLPQPLLIFLELVIILIWIIALLSIFGLVHLRALR